MPEAYLEAFFETFPEVFPKAFYEALPEVFPKLLSEALAKVLAKALLGKSPTPYPHAREGFSEVFCEALLKVFLEAFFFHRGTV